MNKKRTTEQAGLLMGLSILLALSSTGCSPSVVSEPSSPEKVAEIVGPEPSESVGEESQLNPYPEGSNEAIAWEALMGPDGEYAAAASYAAVLESFGPVEPYATIYEAELRHISALQRQLDRLGVPVPENPYSGEIEAPADLASAAAAWAEGEILNVEMYDALISQATDESLIRVLGNLRRASLEQHLPAFELAAENGGVSP